MESSEIRFGKVSDPICVGAHCCAMISQ